MTEAEVSPEQAVNILRILGQWSARGFHYTPMINRTPWPGGGVIVKSPEVPEYTAVFFTDPRNPKGEPLVVGGKDHWDALCVATVAMQTIMNLIDQGALVKP